MFLKCRLGSHDWKRVYLTEDSCKMIEKCSRCGAIKGQPIVMHTWEWIQQNPCLSSQICKRCGTTSQVYQKEHQWEWVQQNACLSQQVCKRCGAIGQINQKEHQWEETYKPNSYEIQRTCKYCGVMSTSVSELSKFIGQEVIKPALMTLIAAACQEKRVLRHLLFCGRDGMGKMTLARIVAAEMGADLKIISGKMIDVSRFVEMLTNVSAGDFLIIEQIEAVRKHVLETLIQAIRDFTLDIVIDRGHAASSIKLSIHPFTLVGLTSRPTRLDERLNSVMLPFTFSPYEQGEISRIICLLAAREGVNIQEDVMDLLAQQCRGLPGEALFLLRKVHEYAIAYADGQITLTIAKNALAIFDQKSALPVFERQQIPDDVKMFVWQRDKGRCAKCGSQQNLEYDHIIPISKGGSNTPRNIQLLCEKCNRSKSANII